MSDYSWGSVAFHYGRWFSHPRWGWCWWPDTVWSPSWVTWRYDSGNCGWAPLPPNSIYTPGFGFTYFGRSVGLGFDFQLGVGAFTFVPWGRFCDPYPYRYCLSRPRSIAIYHETAVVNNFGGDRNFVANRGISPERVKEHSHVEVRTVKIREERATAGSPRPARLENYGRTLVVDRPVPSRVESRESIDSSAGKNSARIESPRRTESRPGGRPGSIIVNGTPSSPATSKSVRPEVTTAVERTSRPEQNVTARNRENRATVVRIPQQPAAVATPTPTPVTRPTPIFSKPTIVETRPQLPTRPIYTAPVSRPTTVDNGRNNRMSERNTWNNRVERPTAVAPSYSSRPAQNREVVDSAPSAVFNRPNVSVPRPEVRSPQRSQPMERSIRIPNESRVTAPSYVAPPSAPSRPTYTPPAPAPSAPRVESRPAPSRTESAPTPSRPGRR